MMGLLNVLTEECIFQSLLKSRVSIPLNRVGMGRYQEEDTADVGLPLPRSAIAGPMTFNRAGVIVFDCTIYGERRRDDERTHMAIWYRDAWYPLSPSTS